jgi:hypothetical protein
VTTEDDVASAGEILSSVIRVKILPFFNEYENVQALDKAVNCGQPGIDITQNPLGAMHRVILAHLASNADSDRLVARRNYGREGRAPQICAAPVLVRMHEPSGLNAIPFNEP